MREFSIFELNDFINNPIYDLLIFIKHIYLSIIITVLFNEPSAVRLQI